MDSGLIIVGINHRTCTVEVRERFWIPEARKFPVLQELVRHEAIEEAVILATCNRTEFILWSSNPSAATEAVRQFLRCEHDLKDSEWASFFRLEGEAALRHIFRVTASLDSMIVGEPEITGQVKAAWAGAQQAGTTGRFLDAVFQKALTVAKRVRNETQIGVAAVSVPYAAVELAKQIFGGLSGRKVLILGAGKMGELSARYLISSGANTVCVTNRTYAHAAELAATLGGVAVPFEERWKHLAEADIIISSTGCPHLILTRDDAERIRQARQGRPAFLIDIAVPRDVDPAVREVPGIFLYDIDDLGQVVARNLEQRQAAAGQAEKLVAREAQVFVKKLAAERVVPLIVALRARLEEVRREEMARYLAEAGPLSESEEQMLDALTSRMVQRIATQLARELKHDPEEAGQEHLIATVRRLFHLARPEDVFAG